MPGYHSSQGQGYICGLTRVLNLGQLFDQENSPHSPATARFKPRSGNLHAPNPCGACMHAKSIQSCPTLCDSADWSPPGSTIHGILQARILEWVARSSSRGSFCLRDQTQVSYISCIGRWLLYHYHHLGSPKLLPSLQICNHQ